MVIKSIPIPCLYYLFHILYLILHIRYMSYNIKWVRFHGLITLICIQNMKYNCFDWWWIFTLLLRYCCLYKISTTIQDKISILNNVNVWFNIYTIDILFWMACSLILFINIWVYFIYINNLFFSLNWILLNMIFWK